MTEHIEPAVLPGDQFHCASDRWLGRSIRWATSDRGRRGHHELARAEVSHSGLVVAAAPSIHEAMVIEAVRTVRHVRVRDVYGPEERITVWRPVNIPPEDIAAIVELAHADVGQRYPYGQLVLQLADALIPGRPRVFRRFAGISGRYVCSPSVGVWFARKGYSFGVVDAGSLSPDCIHDYQRTHPHHWRELRALLPLGVV